MHTPYGAELILDLHGCNTALFDKKGLTDYLEKLCDLIEMEREDLHFWGDADCPELLERNPKTYGCSAVQFIITSSVVIHSLPLYRDGSIYINVFSCKPFDRDAATAFTEGFFRAKECTARLIERI